METDTEYSSQHQEHGEIDDGVVNVVMRHGMMMKMMLRMWERWRMIVLMIMMVRQLLPLLVQQQKSLILSFGLIFGNLILAHEVFHWIVNNFLVDHFNWLFSNIILIT